MHKCQKDYNLVEYIYITKVEHIYLHGQMIDIHMLVIPS